MRKATKLLAGLLGSCLLFQPELGRASFWPGAAQEVERTLEKANVEGRRSAARRIAELSPAVLRGALERALGDPDLEVRLIALRTALAFEVEELSGFAIDSLKSRSAAERALAVEFLSLAPTDEEVLALESMASDADAVVRSRVAEALARVPEERVASATTRLLSLLDDPEATVRVEVAASLGRLGQSSAVLALAARLNDPEADVRAQVALALGAIGSETAIPALQVALLDSQDSVVTAVVSALGALASEDAIVGLVALAEKFPSRAQGEAALLALVRLAAFPAAREHVLALLESPQHRAVLQQVFLRHLPDALPILIECVRTFSSEIAFACAYSLRGQDAAVADIVQAQEQGRLSASQVLEALNGVPDRTAIVLSLERLSLGTPAEFRAALRYLKSIDELPKEAEGPLSEAVSSKGRSVNDVISLVQVLGSVRGVSRSKELTSLLTATDDSVKRAASQALARRGVTGEELRNLLLGESPIASGALLGLSEGMTKKQAEVLIRLAAEGRFGRRGAFLGVFFAMPETLSTDSLHELRGLFDRAQGAERDALLYPLIRAGAPDLWTELLTDASRADRIKMAQLSWYQPRAVTLSRHLLRDTESDVAALSALSLGRNGSARDGAALGQLALSSRPYVVRAAAVQGLVLLTERGEKVVVPDRLLSKDSCDSAHDLYRAQVTRLAASLGLACGGRTLEDILRRDLDPRQRRLAASLLRRKVPDSPALRTCRFYESRLDVSHLCSSSPEAATRRTATALPYRVQEIRANGHPLKLTPFSVRTPGSALERPDVADFALRLLTDRSGQVVLPVTSHEAIDPEWFF